jgi:hypothetical protein
MIGTMTGEVNIFGPNHITELLAFLGKGSFRSLVPAFVLLLMVSGTSFISKKNIRTRILKKIHQKT